MNGTPMGFVQRSTSTLLVVEGLVSVRYLVRHGTFDAAVDRDGLDVLVTCHRARPAGQSQFIGSARIVPEPKRRSYVKCYHDQGVVYLRDTFLREVVSLIADRLWEGSGVPERGRKQEVWWTLPAGRPDEILFQGGELAEAA